MPNLTYTVKYHSGISTVIATDYIEPDPHSHSPRSEAKELAHARALELGAVFYVITDSLPVTKTGGPLTEVIWPLAPLPRG